MTRFEEYVNAHLEAAVVMAIIRSAGDSKTVSMEDVILVATVAVRDVLAAAADAHNRQRDQRMEDFLKGLSLPSATYATPSPIPNE